MPAQHGLIADLWAVQVDFSEKVKVIDMSLKLVFTVYTVRGLFIL